MNKSSVFICQISSVADAKNCCVQALYLRSCYGSLGRRDIGGELRPTVFPAWCSFLLSRDLLASTAALISAPKAAVSSCVGIDGRGSPLKGGTLVGGTLIDSTVADGKVR